MLNYHVVTMNKMAVSIQRRKLKANFWVIVQFVSILKQIRKRIIHKTIGF